MPQGIEYIGKKSKRCGCCKDYLMKGDLFSWFSMVTDDFLCDICFKCARRELFGSNYKHSKGYKRWLEKLEEQ